MVEDNLVVRLELLGVLLLLVFRVPVTLDLCDNGAYLLESLGMFIL